jgi:hypothetical protein
MTSIALRPAVLFFSFTGVNTAASISVPSETWLELEAA